MKEKCPCRRKCERHGNCDVCKQYHSASEKKLLTACEQIELRKAKKSRKKADK